MNSLWTNIFRPKAMNAHALLRQIPVFADLDRRELDEVQKILYRRQYQPGEVIFRQRDPGVGMYVIERGEVEIIHEPTGRTLAELSDGDFFGEIALLNETPRSARATARAAATLYGLFQPELYDLIRRSPGIGVKVLLPLARSLGARLIHADLELEGLHARLAECEQRAAGDSAGDEADPEPTPDCDATLG